jgi:hypothetical protein
LVAHGSGRSGERDAKHMERPGDRKHPFRSGFWCASDG